MLFRSQILLCTGANSTGTCQYKVFEMGVCNQLAEPFWRDTRTFALDGEAFGCFPRATNCGDVCTSPSGCTLGGVDTHYRYKYDLSAVGWERLLSSFDCHPKEDGAAAAN